MIARVVVDVPVAAVDRPFDYAVPPALSPLVRVGIRVLVPFGPRQVIGFVVDVDEADGKTEAAGKALKAIAAVLDPEPPLTEELVALGAWMAEAYLCPRSAAYQAMLPSALKARTEKRLRLRGEPPPLLAPSAEEAAFVEALRRRGHLTFDEAMKRFPGAAALMRRWVEEGVLDVFYAAVDRAGTKTVTRVVPAVDPEALRRARDALSPRAVRQRAVLDALLAAPHPPTLADLLAAAGAPRSAVTALVEKGLLHLVEEEVYRDPYAAASFAPSSPPPLTAQQEAAVCRISEALASGQPHTLLVHGVTGSGKTEVYLQAIARTLESGRQAIVLVPEIALTPQMVERFKGRFGARVAVLHSRLSVGERYDEWRKIRRGEVDVAVGARSAVFAPFTRLGLLVIDEEHETSYKQEEQPKYHARAVARWRAERHGAVLVLGSATPALETYAASKSGRIERIVLTERPGGGRLPTVTVVDMREELRAGNRSMFSRRLREAIERRLSCGEQVVLFLNRRGYATFVLCRVCGYVAQCPHCDLSLTYHLAGRMLRCHTCGHAEPEPARCPSCGSPHVRYFGAGTQRVEEALARTFPGIRVIRMDVDTTRAKGAHEVLLGRFRSGEADVLLGTQMIAKGLDFPNVTLVGVIAADTLLRLPDFRAAERTFQLLTQVAGRAGRGERPGEVIVQTYAPEHYSIRLAQSHDYAAFAERELAVRRKGMYPPFSRLILLTLSGRDVRAVQKAAGDVAARIRRAVDDTAQVLGPSPSPVLRVNDRYRFQCVLKYKNESLVKPAVKAVLAEVERALSAQGVGLSVDVDPMVLW
ncbi:primosomal protein N' [Calditerricola satsumensis]|uniref:Replication restart protein PriA n=1 Tax=Calditerricola satsumensis TaxID=373054 RepID=A0A8J3BB83_9BACI|nr:primosomal protein N' [Calditerricola satsumensis]GGJ91903.1 primosomal protein N' [Calditerricola satsumensis]